MRCNHSFHIRKASPLTKETLGAEWVIFGVNIDGVETGVEIFFTRDQRYQVLKKYIELNEFDELNPEDILYYLEAA